MFAGNQPITIQNTCFTLLFINKYHHLGRFKKANS